MFGSGFKDCMFEIIIEKKKKEWEKVEKRSNEIESNDFILLIDINPYHLLSFPTHQFVINFDAAIYY